MVRLREGNVLSGGPGFGRQGFVVEFADFEVSSMQVFSL
jgi:predicted PilT family ATPase